MSTSRRACQAIAEGPQTVAISGRVTPAYQPFARSPGDGDGRFPAPRPTGEYIVQQWFDELDREGAEDELALEGKPITDENVEQWLKDWAHPSLSSPP